MQSRLAQIKRLKRKLSKAAECGDVAAMHNLQARIEALEVPLKLHQDAQDATSTKIQEIAVAAFHDEPGYGFGV